MRKAFGQKKFLGIPRFRKGGKAEDPKTNAPPVDSRGANDTAPPSTALFGNAGQEEASNYDDDEEESLYDESDGETYPSQYSDQVDEEPSEYSDEYDEGTYEDSQMGSTYDEDEDELYDEEEDYQDSQGDADDYDSQDSAYGYGNETESYVETAEDDRGNEDYYEDEDAASEESNETIPAHDMNESAMPGSAGATQKEVSSGQDASYAASGGASAGGAAAGGAAAGGAAAGGAAAGGAVGGGIGLLGANRFLRGKREQNNTVDPYSAPDDTQPRRGFFSRLQRLGKRRNIDSGNGDQGTNNILSSSHGAVADLERKGSLTRATQLREDAERDLTESQAGESVAAVAHDRTVEEGTAPRSAVIQPTAQAAAVQAPNTRAPVAANGHLAPSLSTGSYSSTYDSQYSDSVTGSPQRSPSISVNEEDPYVSYASNRSRSDRSGLKENGSRSDPSEVLVHEGARRRVPEIVDPFARRFPRENLMRPESIQPSLVETDSQSGGQQHSPLLPISGPLSAQNEAQAVPQRILSKQTQPTPRIATDLQEAAPIVSHSRSDSMEFQDAPTMPLTSEALSSLDKSSRVPRSRGTSRHAPSASAGTSEAFTAAQTDADTFATASPGQSPSRRRRIADISGAEQQLRRRKGVPPVPPIPSLPKSESETTGPTIRGDASPKRVSAFYSQSFHGLEYKSPHAAKSRQKLENSRQQQKIPKTAKNYLLTPSVAPTETESDQGDAVMPEEKPPSAGWLVDDMTSEQLYYFIHELVSKELRWELDRSWLLTTFERPVRRSRDRSLLDNDSRANDFPDDEALDDDDDEDAVFRRDVYEPQPGVPDLPILRFLLKNAFCTFPLFVQPASRSKSGKPPANKAAIARSFFFAAILPILRELQARSLSASVDRHGESDGTPFSAMSMMQSVLSQLQDVAVRYVTAVLRIGPGNPYFGGEESTMRPWAWPSANLLPPEAYVSYRKPTERLRYGGFEVDIVAVRVHSATNRDFVLRIRRPNRTDEFVVRNDADWVEFAAKLAHELGPFVHVRPLPRLPGREMQPLPSDTTTETTYDTEFTRSRSGRSRPTRTTRTDTDSSFDSDSRSFASSYLTDTTYDRDMSSSYLDESYDSEDYSDSDESDGTYRHDDVEGLEKRPRPIPKFEVDRRLLRSWLRDTLAIRSISSSHEVRAFLSIGSFGDRELGTDDLLNIAERRRVDCRRIEEREMDAEMAGENVLCIRRVQQRIWADCVDGDGFLKAFDAIKSTPDFWDLPTSYQTMVSWGNLRLARFLYGVFVQGDESRANLARARDMYETIPWRRLAAALRLPAASTVMEWQKQFLRNKFLQTLLQITFEDNPVAMDEDLRNLQREIGSDVMIKKLRAYVESPDDLKRLVRRHAQFADIPLVAAIVRGSDAPKLSKGEVQRVILATRSYNEFLKTQPNAARKKAHREPGYLLITNLQRVLRLYSLHRDVTQIRGMLQDPTILDALSAFFDPLKDALMRIHRVKNAHVDLLHFSAYLGRLLDLLESLRARIQDPARSMNMLAAFLDRGAPHWYNFLHRLTQVDSVVFSAFAWLRHLAMTVGVGSEDLSQFWEPPVEAMQDTEVDKTADALDAANLAEHSAAGDHDIPHKPTKLQLDPTILSEAHALADAARHKRAREMEIGCRWSAGDTEGDFSIQVFGDGAGKIRQEPFLPKEPRDAPPTTAIDTLLRSFREAVSSALSK